MRLRLLFLPALFIAFALQSQTPAINWIKKNGPLGGEIIDVEVDASTGKVYLIDGDYAPYVSADNGVTWQKLSFEGSNTNFNDIEITNGTIFLVGGYDLFASTDGGVSFQARMTGVSPYQDARRLKRMPSSGNLVVLAYQSIYTSANNGETWTLKNSTLGTVDSRYLEVNNVDQIFIVKQNGSFIYRPFRSTDTGSTFSETSSGIAAGNVLGLYAENNGAKIYSTIATDVYSATNGLSWTSVKSGISDANIAGNSPSNSIIEFSADGLGMFFIDNLNHKLYSKTLAGATWELQAPDFPQASLNVLCASAKNYPGSTTATAFFGTPSGIFQTTTGGASVTENNTGIASVPGQQILSDYNNSLYLRTSTLGLLKSQDRGNSWSKVTTPSTDISYFFKSLDGYYLYTIVDNNGFFSSGDQGTSWNENSLVGGLIWADAPDADKVFGLQGTGYPISLYYSANKAANWTAVTVTGLPAQFSVYDQSIRLASASQMFLKVWDYALGAEAYFRIDFTYNGSNAITAAVATKITTSPIPANDVYKIEAANGKIYIYDTYGASADRVAISSDGGVSWATRAVPQSNDFFVARNGYLFFVDGNSKKIHLSRDDAQTFIETSLPATLNVYDLNDISLDNDGFAYLVFDRDYLYQSANTVVTPSPLTAFEQIGYTSTAVALRWVDPNNYDRDIIIERSTNGVDFVVAGRESGWNTCYGTLRRGHFVDTNLEPGTNYTYRLKAKNAAGESSPTSTIPVTTRAVCAQSIPENRSWSAINVGGGGYSVLGSPKTVGVKHLGGGKYEISDLSLSLTGSAVPSTFYESCGQTVVEGSNNLRPNGNATWDGTTLQLEWRACYSDNTETIKLTLLASDPAPDKPVSLFATVVSNSAIEIKWPSGFYEKTYVLERSLSAGSGFVQIATVDYPVTTYMDSGPFTEGVTYYYRLKSRNGNLSPLESVYSDVVSVPFAKPNFVVAANALTSYNTTATLGSIWADFNNDGLEDYLTMQYDDVNEVAKPMIFKNLGSGNFEQINLDVGDATYFWPSVGDYDNDHFPDLALSGDEARLLDIFKGNGDFTFTKVPSGQLGDLSIIEKEINSTSWSDINNDGLIDLLILNSEDRSYTLYRQNANHSFTKIIQGPSTTNETVLSLWTDYDNDGYQDLLIGNNNGPGSLYHNNGDESFTQITDNGLDVANFFSAAWGDYNNDGYMDLFCGTGTLNALYKNNGDGTFTKDVNTTISEPNFATSAAWGDYNNDGYLDLMVASVSFSGSQSRLFLRDPSVTSAVSFKKIVTEKINDLSVSHYSVANADPDQNGLLDLELSAFVFDDANNDGLLPANNNFYQNNNLPGNWSEVKLNPKTGSTESMGARITLTAGGMSQTRQISAVTSLVSRNSNIAHFGLGSATSIANIQVRWPNGSIQNYANPPINQILIIDEDFAAPVITFAAPASTAKGGNMTLPVTVTDDNVVNSVKVFARKISQGDYSEVAGAISTGNIWNAVLDQAIHFDAIGTEYYIEARDNAGNMTRSPAGTETHKTYLIYSEADASIPSARLSFGGQLSDWRIIAIPFNLGGSNTVSTVFDEFSGLTDKVDYRIITYQNQTSWLELSATSTLQRSKGYFINIKNNIADIGVGTNLTTPANTRSNLESINLNQGWNMIGNPYLTQISWADVATLNGLTGTAAELKKYNGAGYSVQTQTLEPFEGAFVFVDNAIPDVIVPFKGQTAVGGRKKSFATFDTDISKDTWGLKLNVSQGQYNYELGSIGMAPDANASFDQYDDVTPPRLFEYLEMNFNHPEHHARRFTRDVVPTQENFTWNFTVDSNLEGIAKITWDNVPLVSSGKDIFLLDITAQILVNMKSTASHIFDPKESSHFRIYYGNNLNIAPEKVQLGKAYPNPTKGLTTIAFSLPETGGLNQNVTLDLVDALGRTVGTLKNGVLDPGFHEAAFDATEMHNGFYTYRLTVRNRNGHTTEVNKLIIK